MELENFAGLDFQGCPSHTLPRVTSDGTHAKQLGGRKAGGWCSHVWLHASHQSLVLPCERFVTGRACACPASLKSHNGKSIPRMRALIHSPSLDALRLRAKHWQGRAKPPPWWIRFLKLFYWIYLEIYGISSSDMWKGRTVDVQRSDSMFQLSEMIAYYMFCEFRCLSISEWFILQKRHRHFCV